MNTVASLPLLAQRSFCPSEGKSPGQPRRPFLLLLLFLLLSQVCPFPSGVSGNHSSVAEAAASYGHNTLAGINANEIISPYDGRVHDTVAITRDTGFNYAVAQELLGTEASWLRLNFILANNQLANNWDSIYQVRKFADQSPPEVLFDEWDKTVRYASGQSPSGEVVSRPFRIYGLLNSELIDTLLLSFGPGGQIVPTYDSSSGEPTPGITLPGIKREYLYAADPRFNRSFNSQAPASSMVRADAAYREYYITYFIQTALTVMRHYLPFGISTWEIFNEPNNFGIYRAHPAEIPPDVMAEIQQKLYRRVKSDPALAGVYLVAAPMDSIAYDHIISDETGLGYLLSEFAAWGTGNYPFDGIAYHDYHPTKQISSDLQAFATQIFTGAHVPVDKQHLWLSEFGFPFAQFTGTNLASMLAKIPGLQMAAWFSSFATAGALLAFSSKEGGYIHSRYWPPFAHWARGHRSVLATPSSLSLPPGLTHLAVTSGLNRATLLVNRGTNALLPTGTAEDPGTFTWSPDGRYLAFSSSTAGRAQLYTMAADGSQLRQVTHNLLGAGMPSWSPDGHWLLFTGGSTTPNAGQLLPTQLYLVRSDGRSSHQINSVSAFGACFTRDSNGLIFSGPSQANGYPQIYEMKLDGSGRHLLPRDGQGGYDAQLSPDGQHIAFIRFTAAMPGPQVWLMNRDGGQPHALTSGDTDDSAVSWSPGGQKLVFIRHGNQDRLYLINADGSGLQPIPAPLALRWVSWGGNGTAGALPLSLAGDVIEPRLDNILHTASGKIVFASTRHGHLQLYLIAPGSPDVVQLDIASGRNPAFSPDGRTIAFSADLTKRGQRDIYLAAADGSNLRRLTSSGDNDTPNWSPDGRYLTFVSTRSTILEIWRMQNDGNWQEQLSSQKKANYLPTWSPLGDRIAFVSSADSAQSVYTMSPTGNEVQKLLTIPRATISALAWTPDGRQLALGTSNGIYIATASGRNLTQLLAHLAGSAIGTLSWSPGGTQLLYVLDYGSAAPNLGSDVLGVTPTDQREEKLTQGYNGILGVSWGRHY